MDEHEIKVDEAITTKQAEKEAQAAANTGAEGEGEGEGDGEGDGEVEEEEREKFDEEAFNVAFDEENAPIVIPPEVVDDVDNDFEGEAVAQED